MIAALLAVSTIILQSRPADTQPAAILRDAEAAATAYVLSPADAKLLDEIQLGCFQYFWKEVGDPLPIAKDRRKGPVSSIAAVGFQLASLPIGVERGWVAQDAARERAERVLAGLIERTDNKRFGIYLHFPDLNTGGLSHEGYEIAASTVDHALFQAGAMVAGEYFGGRVAGLAARVCDDANWKAFERPDGLLSMGWKPQDKERIDGPGEFIKAHWWIASDEERLVYFLAAGAAKPEFALPPEPYYRLKRTIKQHQQMPPFVVSWNSALFTYIFAHCYIDYRALEADDPARFGGAAPRVDWFENSRRAVLTHKRRCNELRECQSKLGEHAWGMSACDGPTGYLVPDLRPNLSDQDRIFDCTLAPYGAGSAIMFTPAESIAALRAMRELTDDAGRPLLWRDPQQGGYGLVDAFCLGSEPPFVSDDYIGIDQGPLLVAIENARSGLVWKLFMRHPVAKRAAERLGLKPR